SDGPLQSPAQSHLQVPAGVASSLERPKQLDAVDRLEKNVNATLTSPKSTASRRVASWMGLLALLSVVAGVSYCVGTHRQVSLQGSAQSHEAEAPAATE